MRPIKTQDNAVGLGCTWFGKAVFNVQGLAQLVKLIVARGLTLTACKQLVSELLGQFVF